MGLTNLDTLFHPGSIAVVGASEKAGSIGRAVMTNLLDGGFDGNLFAVNPNHDRLYDRRAYPRVIDTPDVPDLAVIATPLPTVSDIIAECGKIGVKGAVVLSAGGREAGPEGLKQEQAIQASASNSDLRIIGPNCLGIIRPGNRLNASFAAHMPLDGHLAFISQSGAICSAMLDLSLKEKMGYRYFVSVGSMLDVDFGDLIDYVGNDPEVSSVLLYIESLNHFRKFMSAARAVSRMKPIVVLKSGRSEEGARAAASHTGSMAGDDRFYDAAFRRAGAVRVRTIGEFFDCAELLAKQKQPTGRRLTILTNSGGPGVMTSDAVVEKGLSLSDLSEKTIRKMNQVLPAHWSGGNPIDILGDADATRYMDALTCLNANETDGLLVILNPQAMIDPAKVAESLTDSLYQAPFHVFASWMGGRDAERGTSVLNEAGIPTYGTPEQAVQAFRYLCDYAENLKMLQEIPPRISHELNVDPRKVEPHIARGLERKNGLLTEYESKKVLEAYGIPVNPTRLAKSKADAEKMASQIGFPLVMKLASPDIVHKSRAGGVKLGLDSVDAICEAYETIMQQATGAVERPQIQGVTLQPMQPAIEVELLIGAKKDPNFGPALLFGWGGVHAEALADWNIALAPLNRSLARHLMEDTRVFSVLSAHDGLGVADLEALEEMIVRLSHLVVDFPQIDELDINPVAVTKGRPCAIDARIVVKGTDVVSPDHLSISPYPAHHEDADVRVGGLPLLVRPIKPEDAPLLKNMFDHLSRTSIYHRFFSPMKSMPHDMLARFTQIDYDREIALVALDRERADVQMLGVARVISHTGGDRGEFAVLVVDSWQGKGLGAELLSRSLRIVQQMGMKRVWGTALAENTHMAKLARKLGFNVNRSASGDYEMTMNLETADRISTDRSIRKR